MRMSHTDQMFSLSKPTQHLLHIIDEQGVADGSASDVRRVLTRRIGDRARGIRVRRGRRASRYRTALARSGVDTLALVEPNGVI